MSEQDKEKQYFRWAYAAVVALAKAELDRANRERVAPNAWPAGQLWEDLADSSRSMFLHRAREIAGIPKDEFLAVVRSGEHDISDLYGE